MAKLQDKFFNRVIEGDLELDEEEKKSIVEGASGVKILENIEDAQGHKRFLEGDITIDEFAGVTQTYGKWSLSGSHLLIVLGLAIENATVVAYNDIIGRMTIPEWILSKIVVLGGTIVDNKSIVLFNSAGSTTQSIPMFLRKVESPSPMLYIASGGLTLTDTRNGRIAFDLLIDNEAPAE